MSKSRRTRKQANASSRIVEITVSGEEFVSCCCGQLHTASEQKEMVQCTTCASWVCYPFIQMHYSLSSSEFKRLLEDKSTLKCVVHGFFEMRLGHLKEKHTNAIDKYGFHESEYKGNDTYDIDSISNSTPSASSSKSTTNSTSSNSNSKKKKKSSPKQSSGPYAMLKKMNVSRLRHVDSKKLEVEPGRVCRDLVKYVRSAKEAAKLIDYIAALKKRAAKLQVAAVDVAGGKGTKFSTVEDEIALMALFFVSGKYGTSVNYNVKYPINSAANKEVFHRVYYGLVSIEHLDAMKTGFFIRARTALALVRHLRLCMTHHGSDSLTLKLQQVLVQMNAFKEMPAAPSTADEALKQSEFDALMLKNRKLVKQSNGTKNKTVNKILSVLERLVPDSKEAESEDKAKGQLEKAFDTLALPKEQKEKPLVKPSAEDLEQVEAKMSLMGDPTARQINKFILDLSNLEPNVLSPEQVNAVTASFYDQGVKEQVKGFFITIMAAGSGLSTVDIAQKILWLLQIIRQ